MMVSVVNRFVFFSVPKCASTSIEAVIAPHCEIVFQKNPLVKHLRPQQFRKWVAPFLLSRGWLSDELETFCLIREPADWLNSWYRYRSRENLSVKTNPRHRNYTGDITFREFVAAYLQEDQPAFAKVGSQANFVKLGDGSYGVKYLFDFERTDLVSEFLSEKLGQKVVIPRKNVSPDKASDIPDDVRQLIRAQLMSDYQLYDLVLESGFAELPETPLTSITD